MSSRSGCVRALAGAVIVGDELGHRSVRFLRHIIPLTAASPSGSPTDRILGNGRDGQRICTLACHSVGNARSASRSGSPGVGAVGARGLDGVFSRWRQARLSSSLSDPVYNGSDSHGGKYIFQPFCLGIVRCSRKVANSKSESASSRWGGKPSDGSAQSVPSRAMRKLPRSNSRSRRVSIPAIRRAFKTSQRWPRSGWNGRFPPSAG